MRNLLDGQSLVDIADWADEQIQIRGSGPWHYVDFPITEPRYVAVFNDKD